MLSSDAIRKAGPFVGNGIVTVFAFAFKTFSASDLSVTLLTSATGVQQLLVLNTDYTVVLNADQNANPGGTVTTIGAISPIAATKTLTISGNVMADTQSTDLITPGPWNPDIVEVMVDRAMIGIQQLRDRAIKFPVIDAVAPVDLPQAETRAGRLLGFDAVGALATFIVQVGTSIIDLAASTGSALVGFIQAGAGAVARTLQSKNRDIKSLKDFGADTAASAAANIVAIQNALNAAATGSCVLIGDNSTYNLGNVANGNPIFDVTLNGANIDLRNTNFTMNTVGAFLPTVFQLTNPQESDFFIGTVTDTGSNLITAASGACAVRIFLSGAATGLKNVRIRASSFNCITCLQTDGDANSGAGIGRWLDGLSFDIYATSTFYAFGHNNNCRNVNGLIHAVDVGRTMINYGYNNHNITAFSARTGAAVGAVASVAILLKSDVIFSKGLNLLAFFSGNFSVYSHLVGWEAQQIAGATGHKGSKVFIDTQNVSNFVSTALFRIQAIDGVGAVVTPTNEIFTDIHVDGSINNYTLSPVQVFSTQNVKGEIHLGPGILRFYRDGVDSFDPSVPFPGFIARDMNRGTLVWSSIDLAMVTATETPIPWDSEVFDSDAIHSTAALTTRLTVPANVSRIRLRAGVLWQSTAAGGRFFSRFLKNGAVFKGGGGHDQLLSAVAQTHCYTLDTAVLSVVAGDYFEVTALQTTGGNLNVVGDTGNKTFFEMEIIR